jgi:exodeoxyribonuclease-5
VSYGSAPAGSCAQRGAEGLSPGQASAYEAILRWYADAPLDLEFYLAGYAGTGKTTMAVRLVLEMGLRTCVAAYTGKAASVLRAKGLGQASTIHSLIYEKIPDTEPPRWIRAPLSPLADARLLVVDEVSMISDDIADDLRAYGKKILVLGDPGQLPPISGAGAFTRREPDVFLTEIHRQAAESPVLRMATAARTGAPLEPTDDERARIVKLGKAAILKGAARGQVICGTHRSRWGATKLIRDEHDMLTLNPREGERVICRRNDRELGIYNGMLGTVEEWYELDDYDLYRFAVRMDDLDEVIDVISDPTLFREHAEGRAEPSRYRRGVQLFDFGYVITCHSAQGSEWPEVTIIDDSASFREEASRWLYTAVTRASDRVTLLRRT